MADVTINNLTGQAPVLTDVFPFSTTGVGPTTYKATLQQIKTALAVPTAVSQLTNDSGYITAASIPPVPKFAYAIFSQSGSSPYTVTLIASKNVSSITANSSNANITINWSSNYFDNENYCVTFGVGSNYCGNRSNGVNLVCSSEGVKTRNSVIIMVGSSSSGGFAGNNYINVIAVQ